MLERLERKGYEWKVVIDPTRTGDDPGYFYGNLFRWTDIDPRRIADEAPSWPPGIVFKHQRTGEQIRIGEAGQVERAG